MPKIRPRAWALVLAVAVLAGAAAPLIGALAQRPANAPRDPGKVIARGAQDCTCAPCGCDPSGTCAGSPGCAPANDFGGGARAPPRARPVRRPTRFDGKTVLITGGSSGIGFATAEALIRECASVVFCGRDDAKGKAAAAALANVERPDCAAPPRAPVFIQADVRDPKAMQKLVAAAGGGDFDAAVLNAGVGGYGLRRLVDVADKYIEDPAFDHDPISINIRGLIVSMRAVLRAWEARCRAGGGCRKAMVATGSIAGLQGSPRGAVYAATKAAANSLCRSVAGEYRQPVQGGFNGDGPLSVRINCIAPGPTNTPLFRNFAKSSGDYGNLYPWQCWDRRASSGGGGGGSGWAVRDGGVNGTARCPDIVLGEPINVQSFKGGTRGANVRISEASEQAAQILNLISDDASYVNGAVAVNDGGYTAV